MIFVPCIDAGHGGADSGAVGNGITEKMVTLELAKRLNASFAGSEVVPVLTRQADYDPSWEARYKTAKDADASFVLSIHVNANSLATWLNSAEAYHWPGNRRTEIIASRWIRSMPHELVSRKVFAATDHAGPNDDWLQRPRTVLGAFQEIPTVLAEVCYLSNSGNAEFLDTRWALDAIVSSLRIAIFEAARIYCP